MRRIFLIPFLFLLAGCNGIAPLVGPKPTPTECGCTLKTTPFATPTGGLALSGPAAPSAITPVPANIEVYRDRWVMYANSAFGFSFEYPAAYTSQEYGFCAAREPANPQPGALFSLSLGSRTGLTLTKTGQSLQAAVDAFRADPVNAGAQFEAQKTREVGGVPAITLGYHSGGTNRYSDAAFFIKDSTLYRLETGTPSACDIAALNLGEKDAYTHALDSFQFK
ncbi:MAG TPA: hypothetical protein VF806_01375 [Anaerolineaceae bacterium]